MSTSAPFIELERFTTFGDLLKYLRRRVGLTQRELSIAVGYSIAHISRLEQNQRIPDLATIAARFVSILDLDDQPAIVRQLLELAAAVRSDDAPASGSAPYKGLNYFDEADADLYFGRAALVEKLVRRVLGSQDGSSPRPPAPPAPLRFLAIVGASGSGKSSMVRAGLVPALRWQPVSASWPIHVLTPTAHPLEALALALTCEADSPTLLSALMDDLRRDRRSLHVFVQQHLSTAAGAKGINISAPPRLVLVVDQFEELFALCDDEGERAAFIDNLLTACEPEGSLQLILTLRADFYAHCAPYAALRAALAVAQDYIGPMSAAELRQAIEAPAERGGWELEEGLTDVILHDVGAVEGHSPEPGALPLLSHALLETWHRRCGRALTLSGYLASGGVRGAIAETAETVFRDQLDVQQQAIARHIFLRLTALGDDADVVWTRRRVGYAELIPADADAAIAREVLTYLADARLITTSEDVAEVAHEALLREWPRLSEWLTSNRQALHLQRQLTHAAAEWQKAKYDPSFLLTGARLAQFEGWMANTTLTLSPDERAFYEASIVERERQQQAEVERHRLELETARKLAMAERARADEHAQAIGHVRRRNRVIAIAGMIAFGLAVLAGLLAIQSNQNATLAQTRLDAAKAEAEVRARAEAVAQVNRAEAEAQKQEALKQAAVGIAAQAILELDGTQPERAVLLALEALENYPYVPQAESALARAVQAVVPYRVFTDEHVNLLINPDVAWSPDGRWLATAVQGFPPGQYHGAIWDAASGEVNTVLPIELEYLSGAFGCHAGELIWASNSQQVAVFVLGIDPLDHSQSLESCDRIEIFDAVTGQALHTFHTAGQLTGDWSPDGRWLLTSGRDGMLRVWDAKTGALRQEWRGHDVLAAAAVYSPDGRVIASGAADGVWRLWDAATGQLLGSFGQMVAPTTSHYTMHELELRSGILALDWSPDGAYLAISKANQEILLWDVAQQTTALSLLGLETNIAYSINWSPNGKYVSACFTDGYLYLWAVNNPTPMRLAYYAGLGAGACQAAWRADSQQLAIGRDKGLHLWDLSVLPPVLAANPRDHAAYSAIWSPDGRWLATCHYLYDAANDYQAVPWLMAQARSGCGYMAAWTPDSRAFLYSLFGGESQWLGFVEASTGRIVSQFEKPPPPNGGYAHVAVSPDGQVAASGGFNPFILVMWDPQTGQELARSEILECFPMRPRFSPDSRYVAAGCAFGPVNSPLRIWDARTGKLVQELASDGGVTQVGLWSPDGRWLAVGLQTGLVRLYDAQTWDVKQTFATPADFINDLNWSPNGQRLVGFGNGLQFVLNVADGAVVMQIYNDGNNYGDVSPDGQFISIGHLEPQDVLIRRMWQTTDELMAYAKQYFVWRELTVDERTQFGLPPKP